MKQNLTKANPKTIRIQDSTFGFLLILPALIIMLCIIAAPVGRGIWISFCENKIANINKPYWNDFSNYKAIFGSGDIFLYFGNTVRFVVSTVSLVLVLGIAIALMLNSRIVGRKVFRGLVIIPWTVPSVVVALVWRWMFQPQYGVMNYVLYNLGLLPMLNTAWTMSPFHANLLIIMSCVWKQLPYMTVMLLAGLQSTSSDLKEAAVIDGANRRQVFWHVVLPGIRTVTLTCVWLSVTQNFQQFTIIKNITGGGPVYATTTLSVAAHTLAFKLYNFGRAAAVGVIWIIFLFIITVMVNKTNDRFAQDVE